MKWGVFRKGDWRVIMTFYNLDHAKNFIRGFEKIWEIREIL